MRQAAGPRPTNGLPSPWPPKNRSDGQAEGEREGREGSEGRDEAQEAEGEVPAARASRAGSGVVVKKTMVRAKPKKPRVVYLVTEDEKGEGFVVHSVWSTEKKASLAALKMIARSQSSLADSSDPDGWVASLVVQGNTLARWTNGLDTIQVERWRVG